LHDGLNGVSTRRTREQEVRWTTESLLEHRGDGVTVQIDLTKGALLTVERSFPERREQKQLTSLKGALTPVFAALPSMTQAFVVGSFALSGGHAAVQELQLVARGPSLSSALAALQQGAWPALSFLGVCSGDEEGEEDASALVALLSSSALPALRQLHVEHLTDPLAILRAAATRQGWKSIALDAGLHNEDEARVKATLVALAPSFAGASAQLSLDTLSGATCEKLEKAWPGLSNLGDNETLFLPDAYRTYGI
jgi:hypothetical protein